jgi:hypothetical protein
MSGRGRALCGRRFPQGTATSNEAESMIEIHEQGITPAAEEKARAAIEVAEDARATVEQQREARPLGISSYLVE